MTARDVVKEIMILKKVSQTKLAELAGFKSQSNVTGILNRGTTMKVDNLEQMVSAMGYKIAIIPDESPLPEGSFVVEERK